jgi:cyanate lyase
MELNQALSQGQMLKYAIEKRKTSDPKFSLRGLAVRMGLSAAFLSKVFNDKALLPLTHLEQISSHLELDMIQKSSLKEAVLRARIRNKSEETFTAPAVAETNVAVSA